MSRSRIASPVSIVIVIVAIMVTTYLWLSDLAEGSRKEAYRDQAVQMQVFRAFIERLGPVEVKDGRLFAGGTALTGNRDIPEKMTRIFGGPATIFHGDVRIATTLIGSDGVNLEGTRLSGIAHDYIYHRGVTFQGETELFGRRHIVRYEVLRDRRGEAVGALFVGIPVSEFDKSYRKVRQHVLLLSGCVIAVFTFLGSAALLAGRRMENRLAESEERYRTVFETTGCATVIVENDTSIGLANSEFLRLAGLSREAVEGKKSFGDFVRDPDREMMLEYHRLRRSGDGVAPASYEFTFYSSDGSPQDMMCTVNMIPGTNRSVLSFLDITSRKKMEREFRLTQLSVDTAGASIFRIDSEARIISVNDEAIRVLGYSREEFQSMTIMDIDPVFPKGVWDAHWEELREKGTVTIETFHRAKNGRVFPIEVTATYVEFEGVGYNFAFARDISKRKRIEQALRESEELFRHVFERSAIGIAVADLSGKILVPNASLASILGRQSSELTGLSWKELTPAEDVDAEAGIMESVLASESGYAVYDKRYVRPDGGTIWARLTLSIIRDETGAPAHFLAMVEDNTQRRIAYEELREKSEQIRLITDNAPSLIAYVDTDFRYRFVNLRYEDWFGRKREDILGKTVEEVQPADIYRQVYPHMLQAMQGEKVSYTIVVPNLQEELRHLDVDYIPDLSAGAVAGFVIQVHDISDRKRAEQALRESEERFRELFRQNADAIMLFSYSTFSVIDANPMAEDLFGYATEELRHVGHWPLIDSPEVVRFTQAVASLETEGSFRIERMGAICKDGSRIMVSIWAKLITMDDDQVVYCSVRDISAKVQMEIAVKETQAKLIQANKMTSLGMLVSGLAHEINNPNNFIGINSSILADVWRDARPVLQRVHGEEGVTLAGLPFHDMEAMVPRLLDGLAKGSERIAAIVRNLKDFAREDVGVSSTRIDVRKVIEDALLILTHQIHKYTDHLVVDVQGPLPWGRGNPQQIEQVIINLVMNSLQALPDRLAEISVSARHDAEADLIVVTVHDQGVGMTREVLERVTEPFFSTRLAEGGTGLGLSISASIIREHGGTLSFESEPGTGTTVRVILPVVGIPAPALTEA